MQRQDGYRPRRLTRLRAELLVGARVARIVTMSRCASKFVRDPERACRPASVFRNDRSGSIARARFDAHGSRQKKKRGAISTYGIAQTHRDGVGESLVR